jgi:ubiquinone/menaquinone biosynthesis C-methylase UbiE
MWVLTSGDAIDINVDLEQKRIPFEGNSFDVVLCCDVLEHIENIHVVFDELCRVSKEYVIISLPNCHSAFLSYLKYGDYPEHQHLKFYGLPLEKPEDRHKWFFSTAEAERFIRYRAKKNNMEIDQMDVEGSRAPKVGVIEKLTFKFLLRKYFYLLPQSSNRNLGGSGQPR